MSNFNQDEILNTVLPDYEEFPFVGHDTEFPVIEARRTPSYEYYLTTNSDYHVLNRSNRKSPKVILNPP